MSHNSADKLVKMANQIGKFFAAQRHGDPVGGTAEHLRKFWDPRMREAIIAHVQDGGAGLDHVPLEAVKSLTHPDGARRAAASDVRAANIHGADG